MPDESMQELMNRMREANSASKTARSRVKTASPEELTGRGDLLSRTIYDITAKEEERIFPEEVQARKEAAERADATKTASKADDTSSPGDTTTIAEDMGDKKAPPFADKKDGNGEKKEAGLTSEMLFEDVDALLSNPLVKHGYDSVMDEHKDEVNRLAAVIMTK